MGLQEMRDEYKTLVSEYLKPYLDNEAVQRMKGYVQHGSVSTFEHCMNVACCSIYFARARRWKVDEESLVIGAFLHDFYLYDWHIYKRRGRLHGFCHTALAAKNAREVFGVSDKIYYIIRTHMFPLTIAWPPRSKEGWIVCFADKYCASKETAGRKKKE